MKLSFKIVTSVLVLVSAGAIFSHTAMALPATVSSQIYSNTGSSSTTSRVAATVVAGAISSSVSQSVNSATSNTGTSGAGSLTTSRADPYYGVGKAAGSEGTPWGYWVRASNSWVNDSQDNAKFHGKISTLVGGLDYLIDNQILVGVALAYERPDVVTAFNSGTFTGNNFAVAPYAAYIINDIFSINTSDGIASVNYRTTREGGNISGSTEGTRLFSSTNFAATTHLDQWQFGSSLGYLYMQEVQNGYQESGTSDASYVSKDKIRLGEIQLTGRIGYREETDFGILTPYLLVRPEFDVNKSPAAVINTTTGEKANNGSFGTTFGLGVNALVTDLASFSLEATTTQFRQQLDEYSLTGSARFKF